MVEHRGKRPTVHESAWIAVGDQVLPPDRHEEIWAIQRELDFPGTVYGESRGDDRVL